jgi:hypothetical protein
MKTFKHILAIILAGYMLLAMSGLSVFYHYCGCENRIYTSVIVNEQCCDHSSSEHNCCGESETASCQSDSEHDCDCETEIQVFKVNEVISTNASAFVSNTFLQLLFITFFSDCSLQTDLQSTLIPSTSNAPPIAGRKMVLLFHNIKIPEAVS